MSESQNVSYQRDDKLTVITFQTTNFDRATEKKINKSDCKIKVHQNINVLRAGDKVITLQGQRLSNFNVKVDEIGTLIDGLIYDSYRIVVPKGQSPEAYIEKAKEKIRKVRSAVLDDFNQGIKNISELENADFELKFQDSDD